MVKEKIVDLLKKALPKEKIEVEIPEKRFGDYATQIALKLAKKEKRSPVSLAKEIAKKIPKTDFLEKIEIAPSGFINFYLKKDWLVKRVGEIIKEGENYGKSQIGKGKNFQVEFLSANPTGPLTLGNGRGGFFGQSLSNVLEKAGYKVQREYYVNDAPYDNRQIEILGKSIKIQKAKVKTKNLEELYRGKYIKEVAKNFSQKEIEKLTDGEIGAKAAKILMEKEIKPSLKRLGIKFDNFFSESSLYKSKAVQKAIKELEKKGLIYEKEGALWFKSRKFSDEKDRVLRKADGSFTYFSADIAYHLDKFKKRRFDYVIDIWGADHFGYLKRMEGAMKAFGFSDRLKILISQLVRLKRGKKELRMSKRKGIFVTLEDLVKEIGLDATRYFFLTKALETHLDIDLKLAKKESKENPVYYIQYAYARIQSILRKSKINRKLKPNLKLLKEPEELELIKELIKFPELVEEISQNFQVQKLPFYAQELARYFHNFYERCRVLDSKNPQISSARFALVLATQVVLKNTLNLMGIRAPERM